MLNVEVTLLCYSSPIFNKLCHEFIHLFLYVYEALCTLGKLSNNYL